LEQETKLGGRYCVVTNFWEFMRKEKVEGNPLGDSIVGGRSELATTSAPIQDEAIQAILGMNQKHILPCPRFLIFSACILPQSFSILPTPLLPPSYLTSFCTHSIIRARESLKQEGRTRS